MADLIVIAILALITGAAARHVYKAKKSGKATCIGCPGSSCCSGKCSGCSASKH
ncbi:MAG: FeoB-associated Cys-rich membrane protein [Oscillospiraceae bacterium]|nr:FeoB-associated Cys-rich membrane protein [Oscillospiraceae bacterium]